MKKEDGWSKVSITNLVTAYNNVLINLTMNNGKFSIPNFGLFTVVERKATQRINPRTKEKLNIPAKLTLKFTVNKTLKEKTNK